MVDDHPVNRKVLVLQLKTLGIDADTASDGVDALNAWTPGRYGAVLADVHMPAMDGYELARRLRAAEADRGSGHTPIVAVTANATKGEEERCLDAGMDAYLLKPVTIERLRATLERWLPIQSESDALTTTNHSEPIAALDRDVLTAWLGGNRAAIDSLLDTFCQSATRTKHEIEVAARTGNLAALAAELRDLMASKAGLPSASATGTSSTAELPAPTQQR